MSEQNNLNANGKKRKVIAWNEKKDSEQNVSSDSSKSPSFLRPVLIGVAGLVLLALVLFLARAFNTSEKVDTHIRENNVSETQQQPAQEEKQQTQSEQKARKGFYALEQGDKEKALAVFSELTADDPDNPSFQRGLKRAETIDLVYPLLQEAAQKEEQGQLDEALRDYQKAFAIDLLSAEAQQGQSRVKARINKEKFTVLVAEAEALAADKNWEAALAKYQAAREVVAFADKATLEAAIAETQRQQGLNSIASRLKEAKEKEAVFNWAEARKGYEAVLKIEPENEEAKAGIFRAGQIERALLLYRSSLDEAFKHSDAGRFQKAIQAFNNAIESKPSYLALTDKIRNLQQTLREQSGPVTISLVSNKRTFVSVQGVKSLGYFKETEVTLLPDVYTIKGMRSGYKEVSIELAVRAGTKIEPLEIVARDKEK